MYRPTHPRMLNNFYQNHSPYNDQWRPNHRPRVPPPFQWRNRGPERFGAPVMEPGNREHWCETCDRGFPTLDLLDKHKQQHQKCNIDGCQFVAHPKVITKHIQMQHSSGIYKKISKLDNPEEIQKWREERKRRYPTKSNIDKKAAECKEKIARGEKMALRNENRNNRQKTTGTAVGDKRKHTFDKGNQRQNRLNRAVFKRNESTTKDPKTHPQPKKVPKAIPTAEQINKLKPFTGIMNIEMDEKNEDCMEAIENIDCIEDDDYVEITPVQNSDSQKPEICSALTSLVCDYESSDDEIDESKENKMINDTVNITKQSIVVQINDYKIVNLHPKDDNLLNEIEFNKSDKDSCLGDNIHISQLCREGQRTDNTVNNLTDSNIGPVDQPILDKSDDDSGPEEIKINKRNEKDIKCILDQSANCNNGQKKNVCPINKQKNNSASANRQRPNYKSKHKIPSTLLQKLLSKEIRQERNIVLQCIRYIKENNYFDKTQ